MHAGLCLLRLSPDVFWRLTPVEFFAMTGGMRPQPSGMGREGLGGVMGRVPGGGEGGRGWSGLNRDIESRRLGCESASVIFCRRPECDDALGAGSHLG